MTEERWETLCLGDKCSIVYQGNTRTQLSFCCGEVDDKNTIDSRIRLDRNVEAFLCRTKRPLGPTGFGGDIMYLGMPKKDLISY